MTAPGERTAWPSGVGGAQCEECYEFTIVRAFSDPAADDPLDEARIFLCRECVEGDDDWSGPDD